MKITTKILVACLPGIVSGALFAATTGGGTASAKPDAAALSKAKSALAKLPLSFEPNRGQTDPRVQFVSRGPGYNVYFTKEATVMTLRDGKASDAVVRMKYVGANTSASATPLEALSNTSNYFIGNDSSKWVTGVTEFAKLRYEEVYPGIDVLYQGDHRQLRYDFIVKPGASASAIEMAFEGAENIEITKDGDLALTIHGKTLITRKPFTYQEDGGAKKEVASHYVLKNGHVTFELAKYDTTKNVVIDPTVVFVTFLGGLLNDSVNGVAILNPNQSPTAAPSAFFVAGTTNSLNFPASTPAAAPLTSTLVGGNDVFVTKISYNGGSILWSTYVGGNSNDTGNAIAIDQVSSGCLQLGCAVVVGQTFSANFPTAPYLLTTAGNGYAQLSGTNDAFALKLNPTGTSLLYSAYLGGIANDNATSVAVNNGGSTLNCYSSAAPASAGCGDTWVAGYTDSPYFLCPGNTPLTPPNTNGTNGILSCQNANHTGQSTSADAFLVRIPASYGPNSAQNPTQAFASTLYGGFGEDKANAVAYNVNNQMVYIAGATTTGAQNFIAPNNVNLPGITNYTAHQYNVGGTFSGLPGPGPQARGGFVAAFDAATMIRTYASYVAVSPAGSLGTEIITGIAAEGGAPVTGCSTNTFVCTGTSVPPTSLADNNTNPIFPTYGNVGHIYITGDTTSHTPSTNIAAVVPGFGCISPLIAASTNPGTYVGPSGTLIVAPGGGFTVPQNCVTALVTQAPYNQNYATTTGCPYPAPFPAGDRTQQNNGSIGPTCNLAAFVAILDGALLPFPSNLLATGSSNNAPYVAVTCPAGIPSPGPGNTITPTSACTGSPVGNQIEYWAYFSSVLDNGAAASPRYTPAIAGSSSTVSNALAIDFNPTTLNSVYTLGTYQQMYITGATTLTATGANNTLPTTNTTNLQEIFLTYNKATSGGGGFGGYTVTGQMNNLFEVDAFIARFNPNGVVASAYGGIVNNQAGLGAIDRSPLLHVPQLNYAEFLYDSNAADNAILIANGVTPMTVGNAIAVDPTRAVLLGGVTNVQQSAPCRGNSSNSCSFTTTNNLSYGATGLVANANSGGQNAGGQSDGWVSVIFFNDILTDAPSVSTANPFLQPGFPSNTLNNSYIEYTPPPFGPTFDFAISDVSTQTQTFRVLFTGQNAGLLGTQTQWFVPLDTRYNINTTSTKDNGLPGSGIVYYLPCQQPTQTVGSASSVASAGFYNNPFPAPGGAYAPMTCTRPNPDLYVGLPLNMSGFPGVTPGPAVVTPGWLLVSQDINPGVVRLALDRRAAAGLLEGVYVAQFLVTTYDSQNQTQWPPCFAGSGNCVNQAIAPPADNASILVTVRLVVRPSIFLSRNAGILTGPTSLFAPGGNQPAQILTNGPAGAGGSAAYSSAAPGGGDASIVSIAHGTSLVPDWLYVGVNNTPQTAALSGTNGFNSGPAVCQPFVVSAAGVPGAAVTVSGLYTNTTVGVPCLATGTITLAGSVVTLVPAAPFIIDSAPLVGANLGGGAVVSPYGATAYGGNGPGDGLLGPFNYSASAVATYTPGLPQLASAPTFVRPTMFFFYDAGTVQTPNISAQLGLPICRQDAANYANCLAGITAGTYPNAAQNFNSDNQGGADPATQRNDATVHDYYVTVEGAATLSVAAINCTNFQNATVGNWLAVQLNGTGSYIPICTTQSATSIGTVAAPAVTTAGTITNDPGVGQKIALDFKALAFTNRSTLNGIPTGIYDADVYVWSTRAKNSVPGYCLGANITALSTGCQAGPASSANPFPLVQVLNQQTFHVTLSVFDTTQVIQITPNSCPTGGISPGQTVPLFATVANSENLATGNSLPPFGIGSLPNFPNFGVNASDTVVWSLKPFGPQSGQTSADLNACVEPPGGNSIAGVGTLSNIGPISQTNFTAASTFGQNVQGTVSFYACRPTIAPAWLNSPLWQFDPTKSSPPLTYQGTLTAGPIPTLTQISCPLNNNGSGNNNSGSTITMVASRVGIVRNNVFYFDSNGNGSGPVGNDNADRVDNFLPPGGVQAGDIPVTGDWNGDGHAKAGWFRPQGGQWWLDANNDGVYTAGTDINYTGFGGVGDVPVVGDWGGIGKTTIGVRTQGFLWNVDTVGSGLFSAPKANCVAGSALVDNNCTAVNFTGTAQFAFGAPGDTPVVGNWSGKVSNVGFPISQAGIVRPTGSGCAAPPQPTVACTPFLWVLDTGIAGSNTSLTPFVTANNPAWSATTTYSAGDLVTMNNQIYYSLQNFNLTHQPTNGTPWWAPVTNAAGQAVPTSNLHAQGNVFAFGGGAGDIPVVGDWYNTGISQAGVFRATSGGSPNFLWVLDAAGPLAPQGQHLAGFVFAYGGVAGDKPVVGRW